MEDDVLSSRKRSKVLSGTMENLQKFAYQIICEMRYVFRPRLAKFRGLEKIVWSPDPDFLRLLQAYFKTEESRYDDADESVADSHPPLCH